MNKWLIKLLLIPITLCGFSENIEHESSTYGSCRLEDHLSGFYPYYDHLMMDSILNIDTLTYYFDPRYSIYVNMIGIISFDSTTTGQNAFVREIIIRGDTIKDKEFEAYFKKQYHVYIQSLMSKFPINTESIPTDCRRGLIHQRKIRFCG